MNYQHKTLYESFFKQKTILVDITLMFLGVIFLSILSHIKIPLWPVPITGQTFGIFTLAFFFGSRKGTLTILAYILAGLTGFSVFANTSGLAALTGPTGGYIFGFIACIAFIGHLIEKGHGRNKTSILKIMVLGNLIIYAFGLIGLAFYLKTINPIILLTAGLIPFIIGDIIKIALAMSVFPFLWKKSKELAIQ